MRPSTEIQGHCTPNMLGETCVNLILSDIDKGNTHIKYWHLNTEMQHTESASVTRMHHIYNVSRNTMHC
jgi:hypothetical protein